MAGLTERNQERNEEEFGIIRNHMQEVFRTNYEPFIEGRLSPQHLIAVRYTGTKERNIFFYAGRREIILPHGNLDELFFDVFKNDLDESLPPMRFKEFATLAPFTGMSHQFSRYVGERFWQERTLYKLKTEALSQRSMVIKTHFYDPVAKDTFSPKFDTWVGETNKQNRASDEEHNFTIKIPQTIQG